MQFTDSVRENVKLSGKSREMLNFRESLIPGWGIFDSRVFVDYSLVGELFSYLLAGPIEH